MWNSYRKNCLGGKVQLKKSSGFVFGEPGSGKTFNSLGLAIDYAIEANLPKDFKITFVNFDNLPIDRAQQCIESFFPEYEENIDLVSILQVGKTKRRGRESKKDIFGDLEIEEAIDYAASYEYIRDVAYQKIKELSANSDFMIVDALFPTIRNQIGVAVWMAANPDRLNPTEQDWSAITPIEEKVSNLFVILAHRHKIPILTSGTMVDNYENGVKQGRVFGCKDRISKAASYILELSKAPPKKRSAGTATANNVEVICHKSDASTWKDCIVPGERELLSIMLENGAITL